MDQSNVPARAGIAASLRSAIAFCRTRPVVLSVAGGVMTLAGSYMSWVELSLPVTFVRSGRSGKLDLSIVGVAVPETIPKLVPVLAVALIVLGALALVGSHRAGDIAALVALGAAGLTAYELLRFESIFGEVALGDVIHIGLGLWVCLVGSLVALAGTTSALHRIRPELAHAIGRQDQAADPRAPRGDPRGF